MAAKSALLMALLSGGLPSPPNQGAPQPLRNLGLVNPPEMFQEYGPEFGPGPEGYGLSPEELALSQQRMRRSRPPFRFGYGGSPQMDLTELVRRTRSARPENSNMNALRQRFLDMKLNGMIGG